MKKFCLLVMGVYCVFAIEQLSAKIDLIEINRDLLGAVAETLHKVSNLSSTFVAMCAHNYLSKKSAGLFDARDTHLLACVAGGWAGDVINNALDKHDLPSFIKTPLNHPFATSWLLYNVIVNRSSVLQEPANWVVGGYLVLNWIDRYWNSKPWPYDRIVIKK